MGPRESTTPDGERRVGSARKVNALHRTGAVLVGLGLAVFGVLGLINRLELFSTTGRLVLGLSSNGLLSVLSLIIAAVLVAAGLRGGRTASTVTVVVGALFLLSGVGNVLVLDSSWNLLAFRMSNVIFSLCVGLVLLCLGAWGRFTGRLPADNPYRRERHPGEGRAGSMLHDQPVDGQGDDAHADRRPAAYAGADAGDLRELAEAERAGAQRAASPEQEAGTAAADTERATEDRLRNWRHTRPGT